MSRARRLPPLRLARITGWTALGTAWVAALLARFPGVGAAPLTPATTQPAPPPAAEQPATTQPALPTMPDGGLLVLRIAGSSGAVTATAPAPATPAAPPTTVAPAPQPIPAPPPVTSSGS